MEELHIEYWPVADVMPYGNNARAHGEEDVDAIMASIREFGFNDPIGIWRGIIVEGHGRLLAAKRLGMETVPVIILDHLTDEQRRAYGLAHNKTAELSGWDFNVLDSELAEISDLDMSEFGFDESAADWFRDRDRNDTSREEGNKEYNEFLDKFETKKTTDDCYTPDIVYDAIAGWVAERYGIEKSRFVRPFYPGGDYKKYKYPNGCVVMDNPPFSILSEIVKWYDDQGIRFFLFAPTMTLFSSSSSSSCALPCGSSITYENGAQVPTSFLTNLEEYRVRVYPELYKLIKEADAENQAQFKRPLPKYKYPDEVLTAAMARYMCEHDTPLIITMEDSYHIRQLDSQKEYNGSSIFGAGYLLSEKAAAEKAAAEKAAAEKAAAIVWELSDREKEIVASLGKHEQGRLDRKNNRSM